MKEGFVFSQKAQEIQDILNYIEQQLPGALQALADGITNETNRAKGRENGLAEDIANETNRATNKENELANAMQSLIPKSEKGQANGVASLNNEGKVLVGQLQFPTRGQLVPANIDRTDLADGVWQVNGKVISPDILGGDQANGVLLQFPWDSRVQVLYVGRAAGAAAGEQVEFYVRRYLPTQRRWTAWMTTSEFLRSSQKGVANGVAPLNGDRKIDAAYLPPIGGEPMVNVTWSELVVLRRDGQLVAGRQYRITDYVTKVTQANCHSAGHPFDVIVTADSDSVLNECARAILHDGDTYFADSNLAAWELKYSLDNDPLYAWADTSAGKGVIYWMRDENGNECPYDFKNVMYLRDGNYFFTFVNNSDRSDMSMIDKVCINNVVGEYYSEFDVQLYLPGNIIRETFQLSCFGKGVVVENVFSVGCYLNTIDMVSSHDVRFGVGCYSNTLSSNGYSGVRCIRFGNRCNSNSLTSDDNIYNIAFGDGCYSNKVSGSYHTFGAGCYSNTVGGSYHTFGAGCYSNTVGGSYHTFGSRCYGNEIKNSSMYVRFADRCYSNTVSGTRITLGAGCYSNTLLGNTDTSFESGCNGNNLNNVYTSWFGNSCQNISIPNGGHTLFFQPECNNISVDYMLVNSFFENSISFLNFQNRPHSGVFACRRIRFCCGLVGTEEAPVVIANNEIGQTSETVYQAAGTRVISV